jgi:hypothetical protein
MRVLARAIKRFREKRQVAGPEYPPEASDAVFFRKMNGKNPSG